MTSFIAAPVYEGAKRPALERREPRLERVDALARRGRCRRSRRAPTPRRRSARPRRRPGVGTRATLAARSGREAAVSARSAGARRGVECRSRASRPRDRARASSSSTTKRVEELVDAPVAQRVVEQQLVKRRLVVGVPQPAAVAPSARAARRSETRSGGPRSGARRGAARARLRSRCGSRPRPRRSAIGAMRDLLMSVEDRRLVAGEARASASRTVMRSAKNGAVVGTRQEVPPAAANDAEALRDGREHVLQRAAARPPELVRVGVAAPSRRRSRSRRAAPCASPTRPGACRRPARGGGAGRRRARTARGSRVVPSSERLSVAMTKSTPACRWNAICASTMSASSRTRSVMTSFTTPHPSGSASSVGSSAASRAALSVRDARPMSRRRRYTRSRPQPSVATSTFVSPAAEARCRKARASGYESA